MIAVQALSFSTVSAELRPCAPQPVILLKFNVIPLHLGTMEIPPFSVYNKDVILFF